MPKKRSVETSSQLLLEFLWSLWAELGIPGWERRHQDWWIDPEALLIATAAWAELDARLREEVLEWTARYSSLLSAGRFKALLKAAPRLSAAIEHAPGSTLLADIRAHTSLRLPGEEAGRVHPLRRSGEALEVGRPAQLCLRLRALFGVGARAEVLGVFLTSQASELTAAELVDHGVGFTKRATQLVLDDLCLGGLLRTRDRGNAILYRLADPDLLRTLTATQDLLAPRWMPLFELLDGVRDLEMPDEASSSKALQMRNAARKLDRVAEDAGIPRPPHEVRGDAFVEALEEWRRSLLRDLAGGHCPGR